MAPTSKISCLWRRWWEDLGKHYFISVIIPSRYAKFKRSQDACYYAILNAPIVLNLRCTWMSAFWPIWLFPFLVSFFAFCLLSNTTSPSTFHLTSLSLVFLLSCPLLPLHYSLCKAPTSQPLVHTLCLTWMKKSFGLPTRLLHMSPRKSEVMLLMGMAPSVP